MDIKEKIYRLSKEDTDYILRIIRQDNKKEDNEGLDKKHKLINDFVYTAFDKMKLANADLNNNINTFFLDLLNITLNLMKDYKDKNTTINISYLELILNTIQEYKRNKLYISDEFCINLVSRLILLDENKSSEIKKSPDPLSFIEENFKDANKMILDILKKSYSILTSNEKLNKQGNSTFSNKNYNDKYKSKNYKANDWIKLGLILKQFLNPKMYPILWLGLKRLLLVGTSLGSILLIADFISKYIDFLDNKKSISAFEILLIIYENEYKLLHKEVL